MDIPSIPPGFESLIPFTLKSIEDSPNSNYSSPAGVCGSQTFKLETEAESNNDLKSMKGHKRRPGPKCNQFENRLGAEYESEQHTIPSLKLPKGVIRGCDECRNCQKVIAKWRPEEARRPVLEDAPVFYPSEEEFGDTIKYIESIRSNAETYGICRIVPPPSWKPPCPLKEKDIWEKSKFSTRVQRIDKLQNRNSMRKCLPVNQSKRRKKRRVMKDSVDNESHREEVPSSGEIKLFEAERFGFEPGPEFTLEAFQKYADDFMVYFASDSLQIGVNPSVETIEGEYWRMVEKPTEEIEVLYGADLETGVFGSGFPKNPQQVGSASDMKYIDSGWNLNNFPRLPGSVLSFETSDISGVVVPWLYIGMCFSSFCWHVEDHHLYSLNYMHWGAPKVWYGVPGSNSAKLEGAMRKHLPDLFEEQPDLLHKLVTQLSPSILKSEGVPVYRCVQNPGEFVLTFPRAYHAGFNCGFNCAEAVNVAPVDWLPHGHNAIELYREQGRRTSISHDKLLLGAAREAVRANWEFNLLRKSTPNNLRWKDVCGRDGILSKAFKNRVDLEKVRRVSLGKSSQALKMESSFDANCERECSVCLFDLHLSAAGCHNCSPDKYACLNHAKQLCSCSWGAKFFLFRYDVNELNILVEALEGKLSAIYRWARLDLGLALSSYLSKDGIQVPGSIGKILSTSQGVAEKEKASLPSTIPTMEQKQPTNGNNLKLTKYVPPVNSSELTKFVPSMNSSQRPNPPVVVLALENTKVSLKLPPLKVEAPKLSSPSKKENKIKAAPRNNVPSSQLSLVSTLDTPSENFVSKKPEQMQSTYFQGKDVIVLNDDEGDAESSKETSFNQGTPKKHRRITQKPGSTDKIVNSSGSSENLASTSNAGGVPLASQKGKQGSDLEYVEIENLAEAGNGIGGSKSSSSCIRFSLEAEDSCKNSRKNIESHTRDETKGHGHHQPQPNDHEKICDVNGHKNLESDVSLRSTDMIQNVSCNHSGSANVLDRYYRQKGPRIAKVVRRINCNVEPLHFGSVCAGSLWCDSQAIYPKGFKSRVRYINVVDPTNMCYYISEVLDVGHDRPMFMVSVEHSPREVFVHISAARCWELVLERLNNEITKQHKLGKANLPPLQPLGSINGIEMFGFSSPEIVQAIQAMDRNHICTNYWKSRPMMQISQQLHHISSSTNIIKSEPLSTNDQAGAEQILHGLFKKSNPEELHTLYSFLRDGNSTENISLLTRLLSEEIHKNRR